jgi:DNA-binding transcriptional LysR family regulator
MDIEWISDFLELASTKNFTVAAKNRNRSQPAFSRRISGLEQWVGAQLIDRSVHPFTLTKEGYHFRKQTQEIINDLRRTRDECQQGQQKLEHFVKFTALHTLAINYFARWMSTIQEDYNPVNSKMRASNLHDCVESLQSGQSEFMLSYSSPAIAPMLDPSDYLSCPLKNDRLILVSATDNTGKPLHTMNNKKVPKYLGYSSHCLMGKLTNKIIHTSCKDYSLNRVYENSVAESIKAMAVQGLGVGWLPKISIEAELERGDLINIGSKEMTLDLEITLYRSRQELSNEAENLWIFLNKN